VVYFPRDQLATWQKTTWLKFYILNNNNNKLTIWFIFHVAKFSNLQKKKLKKFQFLKKLENMNILATWQIFGDLEKSTRLITYAKHFTT
jgi:hypothetical protein